MTIPLVRTTEIAKRYRLGNSVVRAVSTISLVIEHGEFVSICGRSGSGKSTLMNLLGLLERPETGQYFLNGSKVATLQRTNTHDDP